MKLTCSSNSFEIVADQCRREALNLLQSRTGTIMNLISTKFDCKETPLEELFKSITHYICSCTRTKRRDGFEAELNINTGTFSTISVYFTNSGIRIPRLSENSIPFFLKTVVNMKSFDNSDIQRGLLFSQLLLYMRKPKEDETILYSNSTDFFGTCIIHWLKFGFKYSDDFDKALWIQTVKQIKSSERHKFDKMQNGTDLSKIVLDISPNIAPFRMLKLKNAMNTWLDTQCKNTNIFDPQYISLHKVERIYEFKFSSFTAETLGEPCTSAYDEISEWLRKQKLTQEERNKEIENENRLAKEREDFLSKQKKLATEQANKFAEWVAIVRIQVDLICSLELSDNSHNCDHLTLLADIKKDFDTLEKPLCEYLPQPHLTNYMKNTKEYDAFINKLQSYENDLAVTMIRHTVEEIDISDSLAEKKLAALDENLKILTDTEEVTKIISNKIMDAKRRTEQREVMDKIRDNRFTEEELGAFNSGLVQWLLYGSDSDPLNQTKSYENACEESILVRCTYASYRLSEFASLLWSDTAENWANAIVHTALAMVSPVLFAYLMEKDETSIRRILANHQGHAMENKHKFCWHCCCSFAPSDIHANEKLLKRLSKNSLMTHLCEIGYINPSKVVHVENSGHSYMFDGKKLSKNGAYVDVESNKEVYSMLSSRYEKASRLSKHIDKIHPIVFDILGRY